MTTTATARPIVIVHGSILLATSDGVFQSEYLTSEKIGWHMLVEGPIEQAALSPDRSRLAYVKNDTVSGVDVIYILDLARNETKKLLAVETINPRISMIDWSPDSSALIYVARGGREALFLADMTGTSTMLFQAESAEYCSALVYSCPYPITLFGPLEAKWATSNVVIVQKFTGPMPDTVPPYPEANQQYFLHINKQGNAEAVQSFQLVQSPRYWYLASTIPILGGSALLYDPNSTAWYLATSNYFESKDENALTRIPQICTSNIVCDFPVALSPDGKNFALREGLSSHLIVLNWPSNQTKDLTDAAELSEEMNIEELTWDPSGTQLAALISNYEEISVVDTQTLNSITFDCPAGTWVGTWAFVALVWIPEELKPPPVSITLGSPAVNVPVTVDGTSYASDQLPMVFAWDVGSTHMLHVDAMTAGGSGVRYVFIQWSDGSNDTSRNITVTESTTVPAATFKTQYELNVTSDLGNPQGSGWYDAGTTATFSVTSPQLETGLFGSLGGKMVFQAWTGNSTASTATANLLMDNPKIVEAQWSTDNSQPYMILSIGAIAVIVITLGLILMRRRRVPTPTPTYQATRPAVPSQPVPLTPQQRVRLASELQRVCPGEYDRFLKATPPPPRSDVKADSEKPKQEAQAEFLEGNRLYRLGRYADALPHLKRAADMHNIYDPPIGREPSFQQFLRCVKFYRLCLEKLGQLTQLPTSKKENKDWEKASAKNTIESYVQFLEKHPEGTQAPAAVVKIEDLAARMEKLRMVLTKEEGVTLTFSPRFLLGSGYDLIIKAHLLPYHSPVETDPRVRGAYASREALERYAQDRMVKIYRTVFTGSSEIKLTDVTIECCHGVHTTTHGQIYGKSESNLPIVIYATSISAKTAAEHDWKNISSEEIAKMWRVRYNKIPYLKFG
jgi:hypothetical protein